MTRRLLTLVALTACLAQGCGVAYGTMQITRRVGGESRRSMAVSPFSYEHFIRGELAYVAGDLSTAAQEFRLARAGPEDDPFLIARLADTVDRLGREEEAQELLAQGEALDADSEVLWLARGRIASRHGRAAEAADAFARASAAAPRSEAGPLLLAEALRSGGEPGEADAVLERYLARASGAGAARARLALATERGDADGAAEAVRALLEVAPIHAAEVREAAETALEASRPELAVRLSRALPETEESRPFMLRAALAAHDTEQVRALLTESMPEGADATLRAAEAHLAIGEPERAEELARVALASDGGTAAQLVLGRAQHARGRFGEAAMTLAAIDPASAEWPDAPLALAAVLGDAGRPALAADSLAAADARRADPRLRRAHALARVAMGETDRALALLTEDATELRAQILERGGRTREASAAFAALAPDDAELSERTRTRALIERRWRDEERAEAIAAMRAWIERRPEDLWSRVRLALMLRASGDEAGAAEVAAGARAHAHTPALRSALR